MKTTQSNKFDLVLINTPDLNGTNTIRLGLLTIASFIRKHGFKVIILDGNIRAIQNRIVNLCLDDTVVGLTATTDVVLNAYDLCKFIKKKNPAAYCILGGVHATALPEQALRESDFDLVVFGEGELTVLDILNAHRNRGGLENILGTAVKKNGVIIRNKPRELIRDLDILPMPAYDLIRIERYFGVIRHEKVFTKRCLLLLISRGCLFDCAFCSSKIMWERKLRWHSIGYVIRLIRHAVSKFDIDGIVFLDDDLLCSKEKIASLTQEFINTGLAKKLKWECQTRVTSVDAEKLLLLKEAGCQLIRFGIESGSQKLLDFLKQGTVKVEDCFRAVRLCKKVGLASFGSFIIGSPEENIDDIVQTIEFIEKSNLSCAVILIATPYPKTHLFDICNDRGYFNQGITWSDFLIEGEDANPVMRNKYFTAQQLRRIRDYININVISPLNRGKKPQKLDHRKEIENILSGKLIRIRQTAFAKAMDYWSRGIKRPDRIAPFIMQKIMRDTDKLHRINEGIN